MSNAILTLNEYENIVRANGGKPSACKTIFRDLIKSHGGPNTGTTCNWTDAQLKNYLTNGAIDVTSKEEKPKQEPMPQMPQTPPKQEDLPKQDTPTPQQENESEEEQAMKEIKRAEDEVKARMKQAEELKKKLEEIRKKNAEEAKRKAEEERKRKEQDSGEQFHYKTDEVVETLKTTGLAYIVGPAGSGKTTLAMDAAVKMFNVKKQTAEFTRVFSQISFSPDTMSTELIGMPDVNGAFHESEIVRVFRDGGIILFDEVDAADPSILVKVNTMLANGTVATPNGIVNRNKNCYIIVAANTFGTGPDAMYVGRNRLDSATLDRFVMSTIEVGYDTKLEEKFMDRMQLTKDMKDALTEFVKKARKNIEANHIQRLCSTRFVINASKWLAKGKSMKFIEDRYFLGWPEGERKAILAS